MDLTAAIAADDPAQRLWRDFRMRNASRDRNDAPLPNIWTLRLLPRSRTRTMEASMSKLAAVSPTDFNIVDMPPATGQVPPVTPWS